MPKAATLSGAYRSRKMDGAIDDEDDSYRVPQSFSFMPRALMPGQGCGLDLDEKVPRRLRMDGRGNDIFCMVKMFMADDKLSQPPLLVFPEAYVPQTEAFWNRVLETDATMQATLDEQRAEEIKALAREISSDFPHMSRGAAYLQTLAEPNRHRAPCSRLRFLEVGPRVGNEAANLKLPPRPLAPKPHKLKVTFHH